jgi:hypothetical protein
MKDIKILIVLHIILGPYAVWVIADDAQHPERWGIWYRNPSYSIPYCLAMDCLIVGLWISRGRKAEKKKQECEKGLQLLKNVNRLHAEGRYAEADAAYREWVKWTKKFPY